MTDERHRDLIDMAITLQAEATAILLAAKAQDDQDMTEHAKLVVQIAITMAHMLRDDGVPR